MKRKQLITTGLLGGALAWVGLLSLLSPSVGKQQNIPAEDGSLAAIKFVDKSKFYDDEAGEISLRMDILDPAGKPIMGLTQDRFAVREEGIDVVLKSLDGPGTQPINVILVIDVSGSMQDNNKIQGARTAAIAAVDELQVGRDRIGIIAFDHRSMVVQPLADLTASLKKSCQIKLNALVPQGTTNIGTPTVDALEMFQDKAPNGYKLLMVMTDGKDRRLSSFVEQISQLSDGAGVPVFTIAFGEKQPGPEQVLRDIAEKCNGSFFHAPTAEELANIYRSRVEELSKEFLLTYNSPFPAADGLPRKVSVKVKAPNGTLSSSNNYQIGPIIVGGRRAAPKTANADGGETSGGVGSMFVKLLLFLVLAAALIGGLVLTDRDAMFASLLKQSIASTTASSQSAATPPQASGTRQSPLVNRPQPTRRSPPPPPKPAPSVVQKTTQTPAARPTTAPTATPAKSRGTTEKQIMRKAPPPPEKPGTRKSIKPFEKPPDD